MKKISFVVLLLAAVFALVACTGEDAHEAEAVKDVDFSAVEAYSMDLSAIDGYDDVVVDGTWAETYDVIIGYARLETREEQRNELYHAAEDLLMSTGAIVPLYYYTDIYMASADLNGFFATPSGSKYFKNTNVDGDTSNVNVVLASEPATIDPALNSAVDGATMILHSFAGLVRYATDGSSLEPDLAVAFPTPVDAGDGKVTYTFELRSGLKWSDGSDLTASDFVYAWNRAVADETAADYSYMFSVIDGFGTEDGLNVVATDATHLAVTLTVDVPYFFELCAFPTYMPVQQATVEANPTDDTYDWATNPSSYVSNGAYVLTQWDHNSKLVYEKNDDYWDAANVSMEQITFWLSDDDGAMLAGFNSGTYDFIDSVPTNEISNLSSEPEFHIQGQLGTYYIIFNNNKDFVPSYISEDYTPVELAAANAEIRNALSLLIDRNYIVEAIGQAGQLPASSFVAMGIQDSTGAEFYQAAGSNAGFYGYFNTAASAYSANCAEAVETLKKYFEYDEATSKFTNFPTFEYILNTSSGHQAIAEYLQSAFAAYGITMTITSQEWGTFLETRKQGNYVLARNGWLADFNDPINMLDMWTTDSGNNDAQFGK